MDKLTHFAGKTRQRILISAAFAAVMALSPCRGLAADETSPTTADSTAVGKLVDRLDK